MTAAEVKAALRRRHPAVAANGSLLTPGPWTTIEEWMSFDLLAFSAWSQPAPARARYSRIGYEVKVSRADYRRELLRPSKRVLQVAFCHEFYFVAGLDAIQEQRSYEVSGGGLPFPPSVFSGG